MDLPQPHSDDFVEAIVRRRLRALADWFAYSGKPERAAEVRAVIDWLAEGSPVPPDRDG